MNKETLTVLYDILYVKFLNLFYWSFITIYSILTEADKSKHKIRNIKVNIVIVTLLL